MALDRAVNFAMRVLGLDKAKQDFMAVGSAAKATIAQIQTSAAAQGGWEAALARSQEAGAVFAQAQAAANTQVVAAKAAYKAGSIGAEELAAAQLHAKESLVLVRAEYGAATSALKASAQTMVASRQATETLIPINNQVIAGHRGMSVSAQLMMHSMRSASDSFAAGLPPMIILTEQLARMGEAAAYAGGGEGKGALGKLGAFMGSGWGIAIGIGVSALVSIISKMNLFGNEVDEAKQKLLDQAHATDIARQAQEAYDKTLDGTIEREKKLTDELDKQVQTQNELNAGKLAAAEKNLADERGKLPAAQKAYDTAKADLALATAAQQHPPTVSTPEILAGFAVAVYNATQALAKAKKDLDDLHGRIPNAERAVRDARVIIDDAALAGRADPDVAKREALQAKIDKARADYRAGTITEAEATGIEVAAQKLIDALGHAGRELTAFAMPVNGRITGAFEEHRPARAGVAAHEHGGIDIAVPVGTAVKAPQAGTVIELGTMGAFGNVVVIDHGGGTITKYAHLSKIAVTKGETVEQGETIGLSGGAKGAAGAGNSTGPHLHYEVRVNNKPMDPTKGLFPADALSAAERSRTLTDEAARKAEADRVKAERRQKDFADASANLDRSILEAKKASVIDAGQLAQFALEEVQVARDKYALDVDAKVKIGDLTKEQGDELKLKNNTLAALQAQNIATRELARKSDETLKSELAGEATQRDILQADAALALSSHERRDLALRLLELDKTEERQREEHILYLASINQATAQEADDAKKRLAELDALYAQRAEAVKRQTAGPGEAYVSEITKNAGQVHDALEQTKVDGLRTLNDGLVDAIVHFRSLGDVAHSVLDKIATDLVSLEVEKYITLPLAKRLGLGGESSSGGLDLRKLSSESNAALGQIPAARLPAEYGESPLGKAVAAGGGDTAASGASLSAAGSTLSAAGTALNTAAAQLQSAAASIASSSVAGGGGIGGSLGATLAANDNGGADLAAKIYDFGSSVDNASGLLTDQLAAGVGASSAALSQQVLNLGSFGSGLASVLSSLSSGGGGGGGGGLLGSILKLGIGAIGGGITAGTVASLTPDAIGTIAANAAIFADGGYLGGFAGGGGLLVGPGTGKSDSIVAHGPHGHTARFSNGEYIVTAEAVKRLGVATLDRINRGSPLAQALAPHERVTARAVPAAHDPSAAVGRYLGGFAEGGALVAGPAALEPVYAHGPHARMVRLPNGEVVAADAVARLGSAPRARQGGGILDELEATHDPYGSRVIRLPATPAEHRHEDAMAVREELARRERDSAMITVAHVATRAAAARPADPGPRPQFHSQQQQQGPAQVTVIQNFHIPERPDARLTPSSLARDAQRGIATAARKGLAMGPKR